MSGFYTGGRPRPGCGRPAASRPGAARPSRSNSRKMRLMLWLVLDLLAVLFLGRVMPRHDDRASVLGDINPKRR